MFKWSVVCTVSDFGVTYSIVFGQHPEADFIGSKRQCLKYIYQQSEEKDLKCDRRVSVLATAANPVAATQRRGWQLWL